MKLHATLIAKKRIMELGWEVKLFHQEECNENTHWWIRTNIPYRSKSWPRSDGTYTWGVDFSTWKLNFYRKNDLVQFLQRYYKHHINFWDWEALENAIVYESDNVYRVLHSPFPHRR